MKARNIKEWRKAVLERDNYTCQKCGSKEKVIAHHIKHQLEHPSLRLEVRNGIAECKKCHRKEPVQLPLFYYSFWNFGGFYPSIQVRNVTES